MTSRLGHDRFETVSRQGHERVTMRVKGKSREGYESAERRLREIVGWQMADLRCRMSDF
jgi:hypothetical protein